MMGIEDFVEKAAAAFAAVKALETADPDAGGLEKAVAAVVGFEGVGILKERLEQQAQPERAAAPEDGAQADDLQNG